MAGIRMLEGGFAAATDIDTGMREANHPMGPLELCDFIGLDTMKAVAEDLYEEFKEPLYAPPPCWRGWWRLGCWGGNRRWGSTGTASSSGCAPARLLS